MAKYHFGRVVLGLSLAFGACVAASSCGSDTHPTKAVGCTLNSDCDSPLVCVYQRCHQACGDSSDCPTGERCVAGDSAAAPHVCQLPIESSCTGEASCSGDQVCTESDMQCRTPCQSTSNCVKGDYCESAGAQKLCFVTSNSSDESVLVANGVLEAGAPDSSMTGEGGSSGMVGPIGAAGAAGASAADDGGFDAGTCVVRFGGIALGDTKPGFTSGVATRTPTGLLVVNGFFGSDGDGGQLNGIALQSFSSTGTSAGDSATAFVSRQDGYAGEGDFVAAAATSPSGVTMVMYYDQSTYGGHYRSPGIAFFSSKGVPLGAPTSLGPENTVRGQPDIQWVKDRFVLAWIYAEGTGSAIKVAMYGADGTMITGAGPIHTDDAADHIGSGGGGEWQLGVAASGATIAIVYRNAAAAFPTMSLMDLNANPIGEPIQIAPVASNYGLALAGTDTGFITIWHEYGTTPDASADLFGTNIGHATYISLAGKVGKDVRLPGSAPAIPARGSSDGKNAGFALLYADGLRFATGQGDLSGGIRVSTAIPSGGVTDPANDVISIGNTGAGTFSLSYHSYGERRTRAVAEGCSLLGN